MCGLSPHPTGQTEAHQNHRVGATLVVAHRCRRHRKILASPTGGGGPRSGGGGVLRWKNTPPVCFAALPPLGGGQAVTSLFQRYLILILYLIFSPIATPRQNCKTEPGKLQNFWAIQRKCPPDCNFRPRTLHLHLKFLYTCIIISPSFSKSASAWKQTHP